MPPQSETREQLAAYAHKAWSGWMQYLFEKSHDLGDQVMIPSLLVDRWRRRMSTPYSDLPESEKESDRKEADEILAIMEQ